jgi:hypothetical protein
MSISLNPNALVTLAVAKMHLDVNPNSTSEDDRLSFFINAASERVASWCDRIFQQDTYTEIHSGRRQNFLLPNQYPVTAISEIRINNSRDWTDPNSLIDSTKYVIADFNGTIQYDGIFPTGYNNIRVIYTAGYATFPSDLQLACLWFVEWYYRHRTRGDMGRTTMGKGDENVGILAEAPKMILQILQDYQRCEFNNTESPVRNA